MDERIDKNTEEMLMKALENAKALGKGNVTEKDLHAISKTLTDVEKVQILEEAKRATAWVYELIRKISKEDIYG